MDCMNKMRASSELYFEFLMNRSILVALNLRFSVVFEVDGDDGPVLESQSLWMYLTLLLMVLAKSSELIFM